MVPIRTPNLNLKPEPEIPNPDPYTMQDVARVTHNNTVEDFVAQVPCRLVCRL
jgi:hypothetical protein